MAPETIVAICSTTLAAAVAVIVPMLTFRFALRQDKLRWTREQRAKIYEDLLTHATAEVRLFLDQRSLDDPGDPGRDRRLTRPERDRLWSRMYIMASSDVIRRYVALRAYMDTVEGSHRLDHPARSRMVQDELLDLADALEAEIRRELGFGTVMAYTTEELAPSQHASLLAADQADRDTLPD